MFHDPCHYNYENNHVLYIHEAITDKIPGIFRFVTLPLQIPQKTSFHPWPWKFGKICVTRLGNSRVKKQGNLQTHGNST